MHRRLAAAATLSVALLVSACTDDAPQPPPPPSGGPTMPSASPTTETPSPTPSPSADPGAVDKAAAEKAYKVSFNEFNRLEMAGGATKPTQVLRDTSSGQNLEHLMLWLREDKRSGTRQLNPGKLVGVVAGKGTSNRRIVTACEDYTRVKWTRRGKPYTPGGDLRDVQRATAQKGKDGKWRIDLVETTSVKDFRGAICAGNQ